MRGGRNGGLAALKTWIAGQEEDPYASGKAHLVSTCTNGAPGGLGRRTAEVGLLMKNSATAARAAAAITTIVALIATVGAPFKWY